jgi:hypothetical protein
MAAVDMADMAVMANNMAVDTANNMVTVNPPTRHTQVIMEATAAAVHTMEEATINRVKIIN